MTPPTKTIPHLDKLLWWGYSPKQKILKRIKKPAFHKAVVMEKNPDIKSDRQTVNHAGQLAHPPKKTLTSLKQKDGRRGVDWRGAAVKVDLINAIGNLGAFVFVTETLTDNRFSGSFCI